MATSSAHYCSGVLGRLKDQPIASARRIKRRWPLSYSAGTSTNTWKGQGRDSTLCPGSPAILPGIRASEHQSFELVALLYYGAPKLNTSTQMFWFGGVFGSLGWGGVVHSACLWEASRVILTCCQHFPKQKLGGGDQFSAFPLKLSR